MATAINIFLFVLFKAAEAQIGIYFLLLYPLQYDILILEFYGFLSLFQLIFFIFQNITRKDAQSRHVLMRYTSIITFAMELVIEATALYYLYIQYFPDNNPQYLAYIFTAMTTANVLFYAVHQNTFSLVFRKANIKFHKTNSFSYIFYLLIGFGLPIAYFLSKQLYFKTELEIYDIYLLFGVLGSHGLAMYLLLLSKVRKAKKTVKDLKKMDINLEHLSIPVNDGGEIGLIQSALSQLGNKFIQEKENLTLINGYVSKNIKGEIDQYGMTLDGEIKNATVLTLLYTLNNAESNPVNILNEEKMLVHMMGEYAEEYDAYPYFSNGRAILVFGVPFYYEHQKLNSVECASKILSDLERFSEESGSRLEYHAGIYSGPVICGAVPIRGPSYQEYTVLGEAMDKSGKIAAIAKRLDKKLLTGEHTMEMLRSKFYIEKSYRTKITEDETIIINQIKM